MESMQSMKPAPQWHDAEIDAVLRDVPVSDAIADRLRPGHLFADDSIDRVLADVTLPADIASRLHPASGRHMATVRRTARAAVDGRKTWPRWMRGLVHDAFAVGLSLGLIAALFLAGLKLAELPRGRTLGRRAEAARDSAANARPAALESPASGGDRPALSTVAGSAPPPVALEPPPPRSGPAVAVPDRRPQVVRTAPVPAADGPRGGAAGNAVVGMQVVPADMPAVASTRRAVPGGRGFDLAFAMAHGESPFIDPSISPALAMDHPPLGVATDSYDRVWPLPAGRQRSADIEGLRTEHLLAALSVPPGVPAGDEPRLDLYAVRSLRPGRPTYLVEVLVTAPSPRDPLAEPIDATLLLDHSAGPESLPLWVGACRGLAAVAAGMGPADRLTVIVAEPRPRVAAIRAGADDIAALAVELEAEVPRGTADLDAAIALAEQRPSRTAGGPRLIVVAHVEQAERCLGPGRAALLAWREAAARGEPVGGGAAFVLLSGIPEGGPEDGPVVPGWTLSDSVSVRRRVIEAVRGGRPSPAWHARLEMRFDPATVAAFRLVGHRQTVPESLSAFGRSEAARGSVQLHAGESARVVYEVVPRGMPSGMVRGVSARLTHRTDAGGDRVATATEVELEDAQSGVPSARGCELLLAVGLGESAGRSVHAVPDRVAQQGLREMAAAWRDRGDMTTVGRRLHALVEEAAAGRSGHGR